MGGWICPRDLKNNISVNPNFFSRYKSGELKKELERILLTDELKQLSKDDEVELEVIVSEEDYKKALQQLQGKGSFHG